jgi:hypothetical protein
VSVAASIPALAEKPKQRYCCPNCKSPDGLWEGVDVPGWRSLSAELEVVDGSSNRDVEWWEATATGEYGCGECEWHGWRKDLELVVEGEPVPSVHPDQQTLL